MDYQSLAGMKAREKRKIWLLETYNHLDGLSTVKNGLNLVCSLGQGFRPYVEDVLIAGDIIPEQASCRRSGG